MRRARALALLLGLAAGAPAAGAPAAALAAAPEPVAAQPAGPPQTREPGRPEYIAHKTSGFGLPNVPAKGGAYRYRLMGIGLAVFAVTAVIVGRYLRRLERARARPR